MGPTTREALNTTDPATADAPAEQVVVSFRSPETDPEESGDWWIADSTWLRESMTEPTYRRYLRWAHAGPVAVGEEWDEFVNCGCASPEDVVLRVEDVDGGRAIGTETTIDVVPRKAIVDAGPGTTDERERSNGPTTVIG